MSILAIGERYHHGNGLLYRADARVKLLIAVAFAFAISAVPEGRWLSFAAFGGFVIIAVALSRLPLWLVIRRSLLALPFVAAR